MPATSDLKTAPRFDRTAAAILDAAAHVFSEQGTAANLADVAAAAGVSRATLYRYYPNREALLKALGAHALNGSPAASTTPGWNEPLSKRQSRDSRAPSWRSATATPSSSASSA